MNKLIRSFFQFHTNSMEIYSSVQSITETDRRLVKKEWIKDKVRLKSILLAFFHSKLSLLYLYVCATKLENSFFMAPFPFSLCKQTKSPVKN